MQGDERWMRLAYEEAKKCPSTVYPKVGAVIVSNGRVIGSGFKGREGGLHAEHIAINEAHQNGHATSGSTIYTTLEPCSVLRHGRTPCARRIINAGISEVYIGTYDRNPQIYRNGWHILSKAGISLKDFNSSYRQKIYELNDTFNRFFTEGVGIEGSAKFDFTQNGGKFEIYFDESKADSRVTHWTSRGEDSVYANDGQPGNIALAKYAKEFNQIDDPDALDYESHYAVLSINDIVVYRSVKAHVLIKLLQMEPGAERGATDTFVKILWQVRLRI